MHNGVLKEKDVSHLSYINVTVGLGGKISCNMSACNNSVFGAG